MFKIGNKWMLLCISHALGCRYFLGDFKDEQYLPESHALMNWQNVNFGDRGLGYYFAPDIIVDIRGVRSSGPDIEWHLACTNVGGTTVRLFGWRGTKDGG